MARHERIRRRSGTVRDVKRQLSILLAAAAMVLQAAAVPAQTLIRDAEIERTLDRMAAPLLSAAGLSPSTVEILLISNREPNAFVAGGRAIFLHTGIITLLESPDELQGVIAHEAGHIAGGHVHRLGIAAESAKGPALVGLLLAAAAGAAAGGQAGAAVFGGAQGVLQRSFLTFTRGQEASADQAAMAYLERAGVDPGGMLKVLERFRGQEVFTAGNLDPYVRTHPLSSDRMQLIERRVAASPHRGRTDPDTAYWYDRARAKLQGFLETPERVLDRLEGQPETEATLVAQAAAWHRLADRRQAVAAVDRLLAMRPNDAYYAELKGQILYESGDPPAALPLYRQAVRLAPDEPLIRAGLGRVLLALNTPEADAEALTVLEAARAADDTDPSTLRDLAQAYGRAGDNAMAAVATAERFALSGRLKDAKLHAGRAAAALPTGSPAWLRAQDILSLKTDDD